jgi:hypothetical protein
MSMAFRVASDAQRLWPVTVTLVTSSLYNSMSLLLLKNLHTYVIAVMQGSLISY